MRILLYPKAKTSGAKAQSIELTWEELKEELRHPVAAQDKYAVPQIFPGEMKEGTSSKKSADVDKIHLLFLDFDDITEDELWAVLEVVEHNNFESVLYSSYSHSESYREEGLFRIRLVFPLARPVLRDEWSYFWANAYVLFESFADTTGSPAGKHHLAPSHPIGAEEDHLHAEFSGKFLDPNYVLSLYNYDELMGAAAQVEMGTEAISGSAIEDALRNAQKSTKQEVRQLVDAMKKAIREEPYAPSGQRENTLFQIAGFLAKKFPKGKVEDLSEPFYPSIHFEEENNDGPSFEDFQDKIVRAQRHELEKAARKKIEEQGRQATMARLRDAAQTMTPESLEPFLKQTEGRVTFQDLKHQLVVVHQNNFYVFDGTRYRRCVKNDALSNVVAYLQFRAEDHLGFSLYYPSEGDKPPARKDIQQIVLDHGCPAEDVTYHYKGITYYDKSTQHMRISHVTSPFLITPERIPQVEVWMEALCGSKRAEDFAKWMGWLPYTDFPLPALVMVGAKEIGKTASARGFAPIWGARRPVSMHVALDTFNGQVVRCPLLLADESLPEILGRVPTDKIRSLISEGVHEINQKNQPIVLLEGYFRCVITMNSMQNFKFGRSLHSKEDMDAISDRFFFLQCKKEAREKFDPDLFIEEQALARHAMWCAQNVEKKSSRFGVKTDSYYMIISGDIVVTAVMGWLYEYLISKVRKAPEVPSEMAEFPAFVNKGNLYVNVDLLRRNWDDYKNTDIRMKINQGNLLEAIRAVSEGEQNMIRLGPGRRRYWKINTEYFKAFVIDQDYDTAENVDLLLQISHELHFRESKYQLTPKDREARMKALLQYAPTSVVGEEDSSAPVSLLEKIKNRKEKIRGGS